MPKKRQEQQVDHSCPDGLTKEDEDWIDDGVVVFTWSCGECGQLFSETMTRETWEKLN